MHGMETQSSSGPLHGKQTLRLDLKKPEAVALLLDLIADDDALFEGFRPGVTECLGLGLDVCRESNGGIDLHG